jgi:hypothetical protein
VATLAERVVSEKKKRGRPPKPKTEDEAKEGSIVVPVHISTMLTDLAYDAGKISNAAWLERNGFFHWIEEEHLQMVERKREETQGHINKRGPAPAARPPWLN